MISLRFGAAFAKRIALSSERAQVNDESNEATDQKAKNQNGYGAESSKY